MGLADLFRKTNYFDPKMNPQCSYCQFGKRTKEGGRILCEKKGLMEETASCSKFVYSPLKRVPVKQLEIEGAGMDDEMYVEVNDDEPTAAEKEKAEAEAKAKAEAEEAAKAQAEAEEAARAEAEAAAKAQAEAEAAAKAQAEAEVAAKEAAAAAEAEAQLVQNTLDDIDAVLAEYEEAPSPKPAASASELDALAALAEAAALTEAAAETEDQNHQ